MKYAIKLEKINEAFRATIIAKNDDGSSEVDDIFEAYDGDVLWAHIMRTYPKLNAVLMGGEFVEPDCLTLREAAEASME